MNPTSPDDWAMYAAELEATAQQLEVSSRRMYKQAEEARARADLLRHRLEVRERFERP